MLYKNVKRTKHMWLTCGQEKKLLMSHGNPINYMDNVTLPIDVLENVHTGGETWVVSMKGLLDLCSLWILFLAVLLPMWPNLRLPWTFWLVSKLKPMPGLASPRWSWKNAPSTQPTSQSPCQPSKARASQESWALRGVEDCEFQPDSYTQEVAQCDEKEFRCSRPTDLDSNSSCATNL